MAAGQKKHVVVLGAGFGGLTFCQQFDHPHARVTVVDRANHYLFQPLLYQVATAGLSAPDIAQPIRGILASHPALEVLLEQVQDIDLASRQVALQRRLLSYDYLLLALGSVTSYFGHSEWEQYAPGLKTIEDALRMRNDVLLAFERAECEPDPAERSRLMTIVVVGGGPTGLELAGACAELARHVLYRDFDHINPGDARIILIEAGARVLSHLPPELSASAERQLTALGVQVRTSTRVKSIDRGSLQLENGDRIEAETILWAAGVSANPVARTLERFGIPLDRQGRIKVNPDLSLPGHPEVFAIGDMALVLQENGEPVPGVSPAAMQMARHVATMLSDTLDLGPEQAPRPPFKYWDRGTMATIGRSAAVAKIGSIQFSGLFAWLAWLSVHLVFLIGFRNRLSVLLNWAYSYFAYRSGARLITSLHNHTRVPQATGPLSAPDTTAAVTAEHQPL